jgi:hypothetical protein
MLLLVVVGDLLLGFLGKVRMIPQVLEILGTLTAPVGNVGSVEKVVATPRSSSMQQTVSSV